MTIGWVSLVGYMDTWLVELLLEVLALRRHRLLSQGGSQPCVVRSSSLCTCVVTVEKVVTVEIIPR